MNTWTGLLMCAVDSRNMTVPVYGRMFLNPDWITQPIVLENDTAILDCWDTNNRFSSRSIISVTSELLNSPGIL